MKKTLVLFFALVLALVLGGCGKGTDSIETTAENTSIPEISEDIPESVSSNSSTSISNIRPVESFANNRAWIGYDEDGIRYSALVDTNGNVLVRYRLRGHTGFQTPFSNGYCHGFDTETDTAWIIDTMGNITWTYGWNDSTSYMDTGEMVLSHVDGYVISQKDVSGFDTVGYEYTIYDHDGSIMEKFQSGGKIYVSPCGQGVFRFEGKGYFCARSGMWVDDKITSDCYWNVSTFKSDDDEALIIGKIESGDTIGFVLLYSNGTTKTVYFDWSSFSPFGYEYSPVIDGVAIFSYSDTCFALNFETGKVFELNEDYAEKKMGSWQLIPGNNRVIIPLKGADKSEYVGFFDTEMNLVYGPVSSTSQSLTFSDSRIIFTGFGRTNKIVYDTNGNVIYSLTEQGYDNRDRPYDKENQYSCGFLLAYDNDHNPIFLDVNGKPLEYNFDNVVTIEYPSK